jgi:hypothetical protein
VPPSPPPLLLLQSLSAAAVLLLLLLPPPLLPLLLLLPLVDGDNGKIRDFFWGILSVFFPKKSQKIPWGSVVHMTDLT